MPIPKQATLFMNVLNAEQIMDSQTVIDRINSGVTDKNLLVRFYNLHNGTDIWIDGLSWSLHNFSMENYIYEDLGIDLSDSKLIYDVLKSDSELLNNLCFVGQDKLFNESKYDTVNELLNAGKSESAIEEAFGMDSEMDLDKFESSYKGEYENFISFATELFDEICLESIPKEFWEFIDYEKYADSIYEQYYFSNGHLFDATAY